MMNTLQNILAFTNVLSEFRDVSRDIQLKSAGRLENDAEHSYQLAMVAWYIISSEKLSLDVNKVIRYALVHDLIEVYAGDTPLYGANNDYTSSKNVREEEAVRLLRENFPEFSVMHRAIEDYQKHENPEALFVYCLDKLLPLMVIHLDGGYDWTSRGITLESICLKVKHKASKDQFISELCDSMIKCIEMDGVISKY